MVNINFFLPSSNCVIKEAFIFSGEYKVALQPSFSSLRADVLEGKIRKESWLLCISCVLAMGQMHLLGTLECDF